jgi:hypothetical protein
MKTYTTDKENMPTINKIFWGYVFRNIKDGVGYVKCSLKQKEKIESFGIELNNLNE